MTSFEWALKYQEDLLRLLLILGKFTGPGIVQGGHVFTYRKVLRVDYEDEESFHYIVYVETTKGECVLLLSEAHLLLASFQPLELQHIISESENIIVALQPFVSGHASFAESLEETLQKADMEVVQKEPLMPVTQGKEKKKK